MSMQVLTVAQLNRYVKNILEENPLLADVYVKGELSNVRYHSSGHIYFTLKDASAAVRAVMFRSYASMLRFKLEDGMSVLVRGNISLYEKDGSYQLYASDMQPDGLGALHLALEQLRHKLGGEGLFDDSRKRQLPAYPRHIAVVTSPTGAALQDVLNVLGRRYRLAGVSIIPALVQGREAAASIEAALDYAGTLAGCDVVLLCRGGGSLEELWAFNEERTVRAVARCPVPVVSAVGHETDFTLSDFAADLRAPTPSAAAEIITPEQDALENHLKYLSRTLARHAYDRHVQHRRTLDALVSSTPIQNPALAVNKNRQKLDNLIRLFSGGINILPSRQLRLAAAAGVLDSLSPLKTLARGYSITARADGAAITDARSLSPGDTVYTTLAGGQITSEVVEIFGDKTLV